MRRDRIPEEWRRHYLKRSPELLPKDVGILFDKNFKIEKQIRDLKIWVLSAAISALVAVIGGLVWLLPLVLQHP